MDMKIAAFAAAAVLASNAQGALAQQAPAFDQERHQRVFGTTPDLVCIDGACTRAPTIPRVTQAPAPTPASNFVPKPASNPAPAPVERVFGSTADLICIDGACLRSPTIPTGTQAPAPTTDSDPAPPPASDPAPTLALDPVPTPADSGQQAFLSNSGASGASDPNAAVTPSNASGMMTTATQALSCGSVTEAFMPGPATAPAGFNASNPGASGYRMTFGDEFDALSLSPDGNSAGYTWWPNLWYESGRSHAQYVSNGVLYSPDNTVVVGMSNDGTKGLAFLYGYFEARMKFPGNGKDSAFWMFSESHSFHGANCWSELDIQEDFYASTYVGTAHDWQGGQNSQRNVFANVNADLTQWHTYGMLWEKGKITYYFDGQNVGSVPTNPINDVDPEYFILGSNGGDTQIDWVHAWQ